MPIPTPSGELPATEADVSDLGHEIVTTFQETYPHVFYDYPNADLRVYPASGTDQHPRFFEGEFSVSDPFDRSCSSISASWLVGRIPFEDFYVERIRRVRSMFLAVPNDTKTTYLLNSFGLDDVIQLRNRDGRRVDSYGYDGVDLSARFAPADDSRGYASEGAVFIARTIRAQHSLLFDLFEGDPYVNQTDITEVMKLLGYVRDKDNYTLKVVEA